MKDWIEGPKGLMPKKKKKRDSTTIKSRTKAESSIENEGRSLVMHTPPTNWQAFLAKKYSKSHKAKASKLVKVNGNRRNDLFSRAWKSDNEDSSESDMLLNQKLKPMLKYEPLQLSELPANSPLLWKAPVFDLQNIDPTDKRFYFYSEPSKNAQRDRELLERFVERKKQLELQAKTQETVATAASTESSGILESIPIPRDDLMAGFTFFVHVRLGKSLGSSSQYIGDHLVKLGASVVKRITKEVTHVIFYNGRRSVYEKAKMQAAYLVDLEWIQKSKTANKVLSEKDFPIFNKTYYENPKVKKTLSSKRQMMSKKQKLDHEHRKETQQQALKEEAESVETDTETEPDDPELKEFKMDVLYNNSFTRRLKRLQETPGLSMLELGCDEDELEEEAMKDNKVEELEAIFNKRKMAYLKRKALRMKRKESCRVSLNQAISPESSSEDELSITSTPLSRQSKSRKRARKVNHLNKKSFMHTDSQHERSNSSDNDFLPSRRISPQKPRKSPRFLNKAKSISVAGTSDLKHELSSSHDSTDNNSDNSNKVDKGQYIFDSPISRTNVVDGKKTKNCGPQNKLSIEDMEASDDNDSYCQSPSYKIKFDTCYLKLQNTISSTKGNTQIITPSSNFDVDEATASAQKIVLNLKIDKRIKTPKETAKVKGKPVNLQQGSHATTSPGNTSMDLTQQSCSSDLGQLSVRTMGTKYIITTCMDKGEKEELRKCLPKLGIFKLVENMSEKVTHVICGEDDRRTMTVLRGIVQGCWILSYSWVKKSISLGKWQNEELHAAHALEPANKTYLATASLTCKIFEPCGLIYVSAAADPPVTMLHKLLKKGGGKITFHIEMSDIFVGPVSCYAPKKFIPSNPKLVSESWVIDSISKYELLSLEPYLST